MLQEDLLDKVGTLSDVEAKPKAKVSVPHFQSCQPGSKTEAEVLKPPGLWVGHQLGSSEPLECQRR